MDLDNPAALFSSIIIGCIGMGVFIYGKKQANVWCLLGGAILCIFPYFVTSLLAMWGITVACLGGLFVTRSQ